MAGAATASSSAYAQTEQAAFPFLFQPFLVQVLLPVYGFQAAGAVSNAFFEQASAAPAGAWGHPAAAAGAVPFQVPVTAAGPWGGQGQQTRAPSAEPAPARPGQGSNLHTGIFQASSDAEAKPGEAPTTPRHFVIHTPGAPLAPEDSTNIESIYAALGGHQRPEPSGDLGKPAPPFPTLQSADHGASVRPDTRDVGTTVRPVARTKWTETESIDRRDAETQTEGEVELFPEAAGTEHDFTFTVDHTAKPEHAYLKPKDYIQPNSKQKKKKKKKGGRDAEVQDTSRSATTRVSSWADADSGSEDSPEEPSGALPPTAADGGAAVAGVATLPPRQAAAGFIDRDVTDLALNSMNLSQDGKSSGSSDIDHALNSMNLLQDGKVPGSSDVALNSMNLSTVLEGVSSGSSGKTLNSMNLDTVLEGVSSANDQALNSMNLITVLEDVSSGSSDRALNSMNLSTKLEGASSSSSDVALNSVNLNPVQDGMSSGSSDVALNSMNLSLKQDGTSSGSKNLGLMRQQCKQRLKLLNLSTQAIDQCDAATLKNMCKTLGILMTDP